MIILSGVLVVLAIALLVTGIVTGNTGHEVLGFDGLKLIYVSIGVSIVSALFLLVGVILRRKELFGTTASPATAKASAGRTSTRPVRAKARVGADGEETPTVPATSATLTDVPADTTVYVVPGRKRYHLETCRQLAGRDREELTFVEAREEGFTPCTACLPDMALAARAAAGDDAAARTAGTAAAPGTTDTRSQEPAPLPAEVTRTDLPVTLALPGDQEPSATRRRPERTATGRGTGRETPAEVTRETPLPTVSASGAATTAPHGTTPAEPVSPQTASPQTASAAADARSADARTSETEARESASAERRTGRSSRRRSMFEPLRREEDGTTPAGPTAETAAAAETTETTETTGATESEPAEGAREDAESASRARAKSSTTGGEAAATDEADEAAGKADGRSPDARAASSAAAGAETPEDTHDAGAGSAGRSPGTASADDTEDRADTLARDAGGDETDHGTGADDDDAAPAETAAPAATAAGTAEKTGDEQDTGATGGASAGESDAGDRAPAAATTAGPDEPAADDTDAETSADGGAPAVRILSGTKRYHRPDCALIEDIATDADDLESLSRDAAKDRGCTPCLVCQPDADTTTL